MNRLDTEFSRGCSGKVVCGKIQARSLKGFRPKIAAIHNSETLSWDHLAKFMPGVRGEIGWFDCVSFSNLKLESFVRFANANRPAKCGAHCFRRNYIRYGSLCEDLSASQDKCFVEAGQDFLHVMGHKH
jgi:hypothetical protein